MLRLNVSHLILTQCFPQDICGMFFSWHFNNTNCLEGIWSDLQLAKMSWCRIDKVQFPFTVKPWWLPVQQRTSNKCYLPFQYIGVHNETDILTFYFTYVILSYEEPKIDEFTVSIPRLQKRQTFIFLFSKFKTSLVKFYLRFSV